jgi:hypothetical protein
MMNRRLWSLELSAVMTFGVLGILTLTTGISWKERAQIMACNQELRAELSRLAPDGYKLAASDKKKAR